MARVPSRSLWISLATLAGACGLLLFGDVDRPTLLLESILDAGHAPLFGLVALALLHLLARFRGTRPRTYATAWVLAVALGAATEIVQYFGPRDADLGDLARDAAGAAAFLLAALAIRRDEPWLSARTRQPTNQRENVGSDPPAASPGRPPAWSPTLGSKQEGRWTIPTGAPYFRVLLVSLAAALMGIAVRPVVSTLLAHARRNAAFPVICEFESAAELAFLEVRDGTIELVPRPDECGRGKRAGRITLSAGSLYPGVAVSEPAPDWTGYDALVFDVHSTGEDAVELMVRVHDATHDNRYADRFNRALRIVPGCNHVRIPLAEIRAAPRGREMDLARIEGLVLFAVRPKEPVTLYIDSIRLE